jgi:hypothetical protein
MDNRTISMGGRVAWHATFIAEFGTKENFVTAQLKGIGFIEKETEVREQLFSQAWDICKKQFPEVFPESKKKK